MLAAIVFTIAVGMVDVKGLRDIRRESPGEFYLAAVTAAAVVVIGVEQGILLAIALSHSQARASQLSAARFHAEPDGTGRWVPEHVKPGKETEPGLIVYRFGSDLFLCQRQAFRRSGPRADRARADAGPLVHRRCERDHGSSIIRPRSRSAISSAS